MSYDYKSRLDDYLSGDPTKKNDSKEAENITYFDENYIGVRNVCFVLLDGKQIFLNYNYLVSGEYLPEENKITLQFTTSTIMLQGYNLEKLFQDFMQHSPKSIMAIDNRYNDLSKNNIPIIIGIKFTHN
ncbi:hypothetical protein [Myroides sp. DW712]|uniref:hypothetical protein n=1 Tax=Myroides sp. DW712 TaxID=3389800 RepID=UPI00397C6E4B